MWKYNHTTSDELYHYGVKGMKWGVIKKVQYRSKMSFADGKGDEKAMDDISNKEFRRYKNTSRSYKEAKRAKEALLKRGSQIEKESIKETEKEYGYRRRQITSELYSKMFDNDVYKKIDNKLKTDEKFKKLLNDYSSKYKVAKEECKKYVSDVLGEYGDHPISTPLTDNDGNYRYDKNNNLMRGTLSDRTAEYILNDLYPSEAKKRKK